MRKRAGLAVLRLTLSLAVPATALTLLTFVVSPERDAWGDGTAQSATAVADIDGGDRHDPNNVAGIARWMELCVAGNGKYTARDYAGALEQYKAALRLAPKNAYVLLLLAEGYIASGNFTSAEDALKTAEQIADKREPLLRAKVLFVHADMLERQKKWEEAKAAWQAYSEWVLSQSDGGTFPLSATARLRAIDDVLRLDKATAVVRERIAGNFDAGTPPVTAPDAGRGR